MKSYDGREDNYVSNNYMSPPDIVDYLLIIQSIYYLSIIFFCNKHRSSNNLCKTHVSYIKNISMHTAMSSQMNK